MPSDNSLEKIKKLRELTGVGFKDCKNAIDETQGDIEKSIEFLRKKGIAKANQKMERVAADGLISICEKNNKFSIIEMNSETDFVAKNNEFISFAEEVSELALNKSGIIDEIFKLDMKNKKNVKDNLVTLIQKIGEKISLRRTALIESQDSINFSYMHSSIKKNVGKLGVILSIDTTKSKSDIADLGKQLAMHIAASSPLAIDEENLDKNLLKKEKEIIIEELKNTKKDPKILDKIALGKLKKFVADNTLLNQDWIMEPKKKVKDILKEISGSDTIKIKKFIRFKVGEGI